MLVGWWPLAGDTRDHSGCARDAAGSGLDLGREGPGGQPDGAAGFDGEAALLTVPAGVVPARAGDFTLALRIHTDTVLDRPLGDLASCFDPDTRSGFTLGFTHASGVTSCQPNFRHLYFGLDAGTEPCWSDYGRPGNAILIFALAVHDDELYAGTCEAGREEAGHVYRYSGNGEWEDCGSPAPCNAVSALAVFQGQLYAGVSRYRLAGSALPESENPHPGGAIYRYRGGRDWECCGQLPDREAIGSLVVFRDRLYASSLYKPAGFFRYEGGATWTELATPGERRVEALCVHGGRLWASSYDGGHIFRWEADGAWTDCGLLGENTQTYSFARWQGELYAGTWPSGRVFRYCTDGDWEDAGRLGEELEVMGMLVYNGKLYAGSLPLAEVYRYDGEQTWTCVGRLDATPDVRYRRAWTMATHQGRLICGTLPSGHVYALETGACVTLDRSVPSGWVHLAAVRRGRRLELYLDGRRVAASAEFDPSQLALRGDLPLTLGGGPQGGFCGRLADVRLYNRALSEAEIGALS